MGQGEDDVEVLDREQIGTPSLEPVGLSKRLTFWAVPIATRVIDRAAVPATVTGFEMTTEGCRSALTQRPDHLTLNGTHPMGFRITLPMTAQEFAEFRRRPGSGSTRPGRSRRLRGCTHDGLLRIVEGVA